ncbi:MAG: response regulator transcription factor [Dermatophilaceae bacterium]
MTEAATVRVVLVDDHSIVRQGLRSILEREPDVEVVGDAASSHEALAVVARTSPDVVVVDVKLSQSSDAEGLDLCRQLWERYPESRVLVLTTFPDDEHVVRAVRAGASGYVTKNVDTTALIAAIRDVSRGESAFDSRSAAAMARSLTSPRNGPLKELTDRERQIVTLLARGLSNRDIGVQLFISETTAKFHVGNILRKLGVSRRAEAVYEAIKRGLI